MEVCGIPILLAVVVIMLLTITQRRHASKETL